MSLIADISKRVQAYTLFRPLTPEQLQTITYTVSHTYVMLFNMYCTTNKPEGGGIAVLVSRLPLILGTRVRRIPVGA